MNSGGEEDKETPRPQRDPCWVRVNSDGAEEQNSRRHDGDWASMGLEGQLE